MFFPSKKSVFLRDELQHHDWLPGMTSRNHVSVTVAAPPNDVEKIFPNPEETCNYSKSHSIIGIRHPVAVAVTL